MNKNMTGKNKNATQRKNRKRDTIEVMDLDRQTEKRDRPQNSMKRTKSKKSGRNLEFLIITYLFLALFLLMIGYFIYSISVHSSRMLPACLFFIVVESSIYKNISLNMYIFALGIFSSVISIGLSELGYVGIDYSTDEFLFFMLLYVIACLLSLMMLNEDLFIERVAREDEKSLDRYEGFPMVYAKEEVSIPGGMKGFIYIMDERLGVKGTSRQYYDICCKGYEDFGLDLQYINDALKRSLEEMER